MDRSNHIILFIVLIVLLPVSAIWSQELQKQSKWSLELGAEMLANDGGENYVEDIGGGLQLNARIQYQLIDGLKLGLQSGYRAYDKSDWSWGISAVEFIPVKLSIERALTKKESYPFVKLGMGVLFPVGDQREWVSDINKSMELLVGYSSRIGKKWSLVPQFGLDYADFETENPFFKDNFREHRLIRWKLGINVRYNL